MKVFILVATIAVFSADISYARSIGKSEASVVNSPPIQRSFRPVTGSGFSTRKAKKPNISRQTIRTRDDSKSRRVSFDILPSEDSSSSQEPSTDAPELPLDILGNKVPFGGEAEPATTQDYQTFEESPIGQGSVDSFTIGEDGRGIFNEGEDYAATLPSFRSGATVGLGDLNYDFTSIYPSLITTTGPSIDPASALNPNLPLSLDNLNLNLHSPPTVDSGIAGDGINPSGVTPVPAGSTHRTQVSSLPTDDSRDDSRATNQNDINAVNTKTVDKPSSTKVEATEPGKSVDDQKENKTYKTEKANPDTDADTGTCLSEDTDIEQGPDFNTNTKVVTVEKIKSNGTPVIFKIYINPAPGDKGEEIIEIAENGLSDDSTPTAHRQPNKADVIAKIKPELSGDKLKRQEPKKNTVANVQPVKENHSSREKPSPCTSGQQPTGTQPPSRAPVEDSNQVKSTNESDTKETDKKVPSPEEIKHGDSMVFRPSGAGQDENFPTIPAGTGNVQFGKTTLSDDVADLLNWKANHDKQTQDVSTFNPLQSEQGSQRRWTRLFRA